MRNLLLPSIHIHYEHLGKGMHKKLTFSLQVKVNSIQHQAKFHLLEAVNSTSLAYLDLAVQQELHEHNSLDYLDLASTIDKFESAFVLVPAGERKVVNKTIHGAAAFKLFPNLPLELRQKIYGTAAAGVEVQVNVADNGSGIWVGKSFGNDAMLITTNEAFSYLSAKYSYTPIFANGTTLYSAKLDESLALTLAGIAQYPTLTIAPMFAANFNLANLRSVSFEIYHLDNDNAARWIQQNLAGLRLPNFERLFIRCSIKISTRIQSPVSFQVSSTTEDNDRSASYDHVLHTVDGRAYEDWEAMSKMGQLVVKQTEKQGILDLWMMLDRCVRNKDRFPSFPAEVIMDFQWAVWPVRRSNQFLLSLTTSLDEAARIFP